MGDIMESLVGVEKLIRKLTTVSVNFTTRAVEHSLPSKYEATPANFLAELLRISHYQARTLKRMSEFCGPRRGLTGNSLEPVYSSTAQYLWSIPALVQGRLATSISSMREGLISTEHFVKIHETLNQIPASVSSEDKQQSECFLAEGAAQFPPQNMGELQKRILAHVNPDGSLTDHADRRRLSGLTLAGQDTNKMSALRGILTPECRAKFETLLTKMAQSKDQKDWRTPAQRNHDAFENICEIALTSGKLGTHKGVPATLIMTANITDMENSTGHALTSGGTLIPMRDALTLASTVHPILAIFGKDGRPLHFERGKRLASADQRLALFIQERGCSFPGCTAPANWCQTHHVKEWANGGKTNIDNMTLVCKKHHKRISNRPNGYQTIIGAHPQYPNRCAWIPPKHIDPQQKPRINHIHHPEEIFTTKKKTHRHSITQPQPPHIPQTYLFTQQPGLCRTHHLLKTAGLWQVRILPHRTLCWKSPDGKHHITHPQSQGPYSQQNSCSKRTYPHHRNSSTHLH